MTGVLSLVGGDEFHAGNDSHDRFLLEHSDGPGFLLTAAIGTNPGAALKTARAWFRTLGSDISELGIRTRSDAASAGVLERIDAAGWVYIAGGDPGRVTRALLGSPAAERLLQRWQDGLGLAGSSAGAMVLADSVLIRDRWPDHSTRRRIDGLGVVANAAVIPHYDTFGNGWLPSARAALPTEILIGIAERSACLWDGNSWSAHGDGGVTLHRPDSEPVHTAAGESVNLPRPAGIVGP